MGTPPTTPFGVMADPLGPAPLPRAALSTRRQDGNTMGLGGEGGTLAPQKPPNAGREQAGDSMLPPGPP